MCQIWMLWKTRNERIFKNKVKVIEDIVEEVKILSWKQSLSRLKGSPYLFYEWCWNSNDCLDRWVLVYFVAYTTVLLLDVIRFFSVQVCLLVLLFCRLSAGAAVCLQYCCFEHCCLLFSARHAVVFVFLSGVHLHVAPIVTLLFGSPLYVLCWVYF